MKVAVCFSGLPRGDVENNLRIFRSIFPHDFFFSTWAGNTLNQEHTVYQEPHSDYLSSYVEGLSDEKKQLLGRGYKQIVGHALQVLFDIPKEYDMIIRCRYDTILNEKLDWNKHIKDSYENRCIGGFRFSVDEGDFDDTRQCHPKGLVLDQLIMHRRDQFDPSHVLKMFYDEKLDPCEMGWYQAFESHPIKNYIGGIIIDRLYK